MTMTPDAQTLRTLTNSIIDSGRLVTACGMETMQLTLLLRRLLESAPAFSAFSASSSSTEGGLAIDPWKASLSLENYPRTAAFLRGGARAIEEILARHPERPVHVIEAGCGPVAALSTPLMSRFGPDQLQVTLFDIHQESTDAAEHVIESLGLSDRLNETVCGDLMSMDLSGHASSADLILLETMYASLLREPQVALTRCLVRSLPSARLLPVRVTIDLQLFDPAPEAMLNPPVPQNRKWLGTVFELDERTARETEIENGYLPAATIPLPESAEPGERLFLTTTVEVFGDVILANYDSEITFPMELEIAEDSWQERTLRFRYRIDEDPGFEWEFVG